MDDRNMRRSFQPIDLSASMGRVGSGLTDDPSVSGIADVRQGSAMATDGFRTRIALPNGLLATDGQRLLMRRRATVTEAMRLCLGLIDHVARSAHSRRDQGQT